MFMVFALFDQVSASPASVGRITVAAVSVTAGGINVKAGGLTVGAGGISLGNLQLSGGSLSVLTGTTEGNADALDAFASAAGFVGNAILGRVDAGVAGTVNLLSLREGTNMLFSVRKSCLLCCASCVDARLFIYVFAGEFNW